MASKPCIEHKCIVFCLLLLILRAKLIAVLLICVTTSTSSDIMQVNQALKLAVTSENYPSYKQHAKLPAAYKRANWWLHTQEAAVLMRH